MEAMQELAEYASKLFGVHLTAGQLAAFRRYESELIDWNTRFNLTAIDHPEKVRSKHFLDSLSCLLAMRDTAKQRVIDVGTGAGFPGIPLKIACPDMRLSLVESVGKKAAFCQHLVEVLNLKEVEVILGRVESLGLLPEHRQGYDWALARAVASMPVLMEYLLPLVRVGGRALAMKGEGAPAEAQAAEGAMRLLGGDLKQLVPVTLPGVEDQHFLVIVEKQAGTPEHYPRRVGLPAKRPL
jgi:16S rRNA (guanine527-N7)-methyltransferase